MNALWQDVKHGLRVLVRSPWFTAVAILTLALGIGANTAIFSLVDWILLRPLPVSHPYQLTVLAFQQRKGNIQTQFSYPDFQDIREQSSSAFSDVFGYAFGLDGITARDKSARFLTAFVTGNYFTALGLKPALGRLILPSEGRTAGADPVLVLGYDYWQNEFGGDPSVIGMQVNVDGHPFTIVGVAPKDFQGLYPMVDVQGYVPYGMMGIEGLPSTFLAERGRRRLALFGRLRPGVDVSRARAVLSVVAGRLSSQYPNIEEGLSLLAYPEREARPQPDPEHTMSKISWLFLTLAALVLLLACVNVANILLVRATAREREMAVRAALGAGRVRLVRHLLTESLLLALAGGVAGVLFGTWAIGLLRSINLQTDLPVKLDFGLDWRVLSYALAAALVTGIVVGIVPALRAAHANVAEVLHEGGRTGSARRHRLRTALVVAQVGGSLMLLIVAGLFTRSLGKAQSADLGFDPAQLVNLSMDPAGAGYSEAQGRVFYHQLLDRVRALPGVKSASLAFSVPMGYYNRSDNLRVEGYQPPPGHPLPNVGYNAVSPGYFDTLHIPLLRGRSFTAADNENAAYVAVVNQAMASRFWPNQDPIGRQFVLLNGKPHLDTYSVIGVVKNSRTVTVTGSYEPYFYVPLDQDYQSLATLQVRAAGSEATAIREVEDVIRGLAPGLAVFDVQTMSQALDGLNGFLMFQLGASLAAALGFLGLILAVVGVYGVVSYSTSQRTHEIGIRMALGANQTDVLRMILRQGLVIAGLGLVLGLGAALAVARLVSSFLVGVSATDPLTYVTVSAGMLLVALAACFLPARRAMRMQPTIALRHE